MSWRSKHRKIESGHSRAARGRWDPRAEVKEASNIARRAEDRRINETHAEK